MSVSSATTSTVLSVTCATCWMIKVSLSSCVVVISTRMLTLPFSISTGTGFTPSDNKGMLLEGFLVLNQICHDEINKLPFILGNRPVDFKKIMNWVVKILLAVFITQTIYDNSVISNGANIVKRASYARLEQTARSRGQGSQNDWTQSFRIDKKAIQVPPTEAKRPKERKGLYYLITNYFGLSKIFKNLKNSFYLELNCDSCKLATNMLQYYHNINRTTDEIVQTIEDICVSFKVQSENVCRGIIPAFRAEFSYILENVVFDSNEICSFVVGPHCSTSPSKLHDWEIHIPEKPSGVNQVQTTSPTDGKSAVLRVLHLSDTHFDPYYVEGSNAECGEPLCCREGNRDTVPLAKQAGRWGDYRGCDTPRRTLESMLDFINQTLEFDYILWTGDLPPHDVWNQTKSTQIFHLYKMTEMMLKYFPNKPIFPSLGNHESSPVDSFPPPYIKGELSIDWLYSQLNHTWTRWLGNHVSETINKGAYYSVLVYPGFRIISINSNYCNNQNWWLLVNSTDPAQELQWLVFQLQKAEKAREKVHIIGHIPPGSPDCLFVYQDTVVAQFYGHAHVDEFQIFYERLSHGRRKPINVAYVGPSIAPFKHLNPGFRVYTVDGLRDHSTWSVLDHETYFMNLTAANIYNSPIWRKEYSAKEAYGMKALTPHYWDRFVKKLKYDDELFNKYFSYYTRMSNEYPEL
ncbi:Sphingomyelin phosphodiesterase [Nymphon striatum]|nr:Sphingomyelin phosphodiesterase [Nymphon striatum]